MSQINQSDKLDDDNDKKEIDDKQEINNEPAVINLVKKRGRKPKNTSIQITQIAEAIIKKTIIKESVNKESVNKESENTNVKILKKRGRKPKNLMQLQTNEIDDENNEEKIIDNAINGENIDGGIIRKRKRKSKKEIAEKNQQMTFEVDIKLDKELDFTSGDIAVNKDYIEEPNNFLKNIWINKYQPQNLADVIGHKDQINVLKKWLLNYNTHRYHAVVISGGHGIGKNLIIKLALQEREYQIKNICSTALKNKDIVNDIIRSCAKTKNVYNSLNNQVNEQKFAIVIDDTESITLKSEKENLAELLKLNDENRYFPIIFISNLQHSKLINNLKKTLLEITLNAPNIDQIKKYIIDICQKEKMTISDDKVYYQIIRFSQFDIRRLLYVLQDLYYTYKTKPITIEMFKEYQHLSQKKDIDIGLYYAAKNLLDEYKNINECLLLYESDKVLLPLTIYENYYRKIFKQKMSQIDILKIMSEVTNSVSIGDVIETNIYSDQNWFLQNIHGFFTCADTSYIINSIGSKYLNPNNKSEKINYELGFSVDLNKTSSKNINRKKNIFPLQAKFKNKNIDDMLYINKIFFELEKNKSNSIIKNIKDHYNLNVKDVQIALKIDKTNEKINEKNEKKFNESLENNLDEEEEVDNE